MTQNRISYGVLSECGNVSTSLHHIVDCGSTGLGLSGDGHSQFTLCRKVNTCDMHIYMQSMPIYLAITFLQPKVLKKAKVPFCPECLQKWYYYLEEHHIEPETEQY